MRIRSLLSIISLFLLVQLSYSAYGQADSCEISLPFCTSDIYTFPAGTSGTSAQSGPDYGCLATQPNPAWYHMKIAVAGDIEITMESDPLEDIDFICWGPFSDAFTPCTAELTVSKVVDCSYSQNSIEVCFISNSLVGEYYILMITNYSNQPCEITFEKTGGTGETDCGIVPPPVSNNGPLCEGETLELYAEFVANTTYSWTGPMGFTSSLQNPVIPDVTVANSGNYTLIVVTGGNTSNPTHTSVRITAYPDIDFTINTNDTVCTNELITFVGSDVSGTNITQWNWTFGDGNSATGQIALNSYNSGGYFNINLVAINDGNCSDDASMNIKVVNDGSATAGSNESICQGDSFDMSTSGILPDSINCDSIKWIGGSGSFNDSGLLYPVYSPGSGEVGAVQLGLVGYTPSPCPNDISYMTLTIDSKPDVSFTVAPSDIICLDEILTFNGTDNNGTNVTSWLWDFGDGNTSTNKDTQHTYTTVNNYNVKLVAINDNGCTDSTTSLIQVKPLPEPDFTISSGVNGCVDSPITLDGFDIAGTTITDWNWDFGDGNQDVGQSVIHTYVNPGDYTITLDVINNNSCAQLHQKIVHIGTIPESSFIISPNDTSCVGEMISFDATDISGDIVSWDWDFGDGNTSNGQYVSHTYSTQGNFNITSTYISSDGCANTTIGQRYVQDVNIGFNIVQSPSCQDYSVTFTGTGDLITFADWNWDFGDGSPADLGYNSSHIYTQPDTVDVILSVCSEQNVQQLIINGTCQVDAGSDEATCQDVYFNLATSSTPPSANNFSSIYWSTNGLGTIDDPTLVTPTYFPDPIEGSVVNDTITMTMFGYGIAPCENDTSSMDIIIIPGAYAQAGSDENSCFGEPYDFANSTDSSFATNYVTVYWLTSGTGYFIDPNVTKPIYVPGSNEMGPVTLTMVAINIIACDSIDDMTLTIRSKYHTSLDFTICYNDSIFAQGEWQYSSGIFYDTLPTANYGCEIGRAHV